MRKAALSPVLVTLMLFGQTFAEATDPDVAVFEEMLLPARPIGINHVRLLGGPLKHAQNLDAEYLLKLEIDPKAVDPADKAMLEDLVAAAVNAAAEKARAAADEHLKKATGGIQVPGLPY